MHIPPSPSNFLSKYWEFVNNKKRAEPTLTLPLLFDKMVPPVLRDGCSYQMAILDDMDDT